MLKPNAIRPWLGAALVGVLLAGCSIDPHQAVYGNANDQAAESAVIQHFGPHLALCHVAIEQSEIDTLVRDRAIVTAELLKALRRPVLVVEVDAWMLHGSSAGKEAAQRAAARLSSAISAYMLLADHLQTEVDSQRAGLIPSNPAITASVTAMKRATVYADATTAMRVASLTPVAEDNTVKAMIRGLAIQGQRQDQRQSLQTVYESRDSGTTTGPRQIKKLYQQLTGLSPGLFSLTSRDIPPVKSCIDAELWAIFSIYYKSFASGQFVSRMGEPMAAPGSTTKLDDAELANVASVFVEALGDWFVRAPIPALRDPLPSDDQSNDPDASPAAGKPSGTPAGKQADKSVAAAAQPSELAPWFVKKGPSPTLWKVNFDQNGTRYTVVPALLQTPDPSNDPNNPNEPTDFSSIGAAEACLVRWGATMASRNVRLAVGSGLHTWGGLHLGVPIALGKISIGDNDLLVEIVKSVSGITLAMTGRLTEQRLLGPYAWVTKKADPAICGKVTPSDLKPKG